MKDTLVFDVRNIKDGDFNIHEVEVPTSRFDLNFEDVQFLSQVRVSVQLLRHGDDNVYIKAKVSTRTEMQCGKCLEMFNKDIEATYEVQFTPHRNPEKAEQDNIEDGERYYDGETFDLSDDTRNALVIQVPIWPLCSQNCEGLCHTCGANLNEAYCTCEETDEIEDNASDVTSPFADLSQLLEAAKMNDQTVPKDNKERISKNGTSET